ncbi:hypothetical protein BC938DRAFT_474790, partial [Jimgerdemannia flammicorona]
MSLRARRTTKYMFQVLAQLSENFIFIYLGVNLFTHPDLVLLGVDVCAYVVLIGWIKWLMVMGLDRARCNDVIDTWSGRDIFQISFSPFTAIHQHRPQIAIIIARYCAVFPLSNLINVVSRATLGSPEQLSRPYQVMLFWAGLRGAVAFALAGGLTGDSGPAMRTTILAVVVLSVIIFGGTTNTMLTILEVRTGVDEDSETSSIDGDRSDEDDLDDSVFAPAARRGSGTDDEYMDDDDNDGSIYSLHSGRGGRDSPYSLRSDERALLSDQEVSISGLLSGPIGNPVPEDHTHWFLSFDNRWLKPFFTTMRRETTRRRERLGAAFLRRQLRNTKFLTVGRRAAGGGRNGNGVAYNHYRTTVAEEAFQDDAEEDVMGASGRRQAFRNNSSGNQLPPSPRASTSAQSAQQQRVGSGRVFGRGPASPGLPVSPTQPQGGVGRLQINTSVGSTSPVTLDGVRIAPPPSASAGPRESPRSPDDGRGFDLGLGTSLLDS